MIAYVTLGTNDLPRAAKFYDELMGMLDAKRVFDMDRLIGWGRGPGQPVVVVCTPFDKNEASVGNGVMVAMAVDKTEMVDAIYKKAMELGATGEGPPGPRETGAYCGYFRDLDGNKLNVVCYNVAAS